MSLVWVPPFSQDTKMASCYTYIYYFVLLTTYLTFYLPYLLAFLAILSVGLKVRRMKEERSRISCLSLVNAANGHNGRKCVLADQLNDGCYQVYGLPDVGME